MTYGDREGVSARAIGGWDNEWGDCVDNSLFEAMASAAKTDSGCRQKSNFAAKQSSAGG